MPSITVSFDIEESAGPVVLIRSFALKRKNAPGSAQIAMKRKFKKK